MEVLREEDIDLEFDHLEKMGLSIQ